MGLFRKIRASTRAYRRFALLELIIVVAMLVCLQGNWYVLSPTRCINMAAGENTDFNYEASSTAKLYVKLKHGVCESVKSSVYEGCIMWDDSAEWSRWDDLNMEVANYLTDLSYDADTRWYGAEALVIVSLVLGFLTLIFYFAVSVLNPEVVPLKYQYAAAAAQALVFLFLLCAISVGIATDTTDPEAWKVYYYGCDVASWPAAGWWAGVTALWFSLLLAQLVAFPYIGHKEWVNTLSVRSNNSASVADLNAEINLSVKSHRSSSSKRSIKVSGVAPMVDPLASPPEPPTSALSLRNVDRMSFYFDDNASSEENEEEEEDPYL